MEANEPFVNRIISLAIEEDLGRGDITTELTVPQDLKKTGSAIARQDLTMSGGDVFAAVMHRVDPEIIIEITAHDGERVLEGGLLLTAQGKVSSLLKAERVALNFLQRLCGLATFTGKFVDKLPKGCAAAITDTRKTTPGMRFLEKRAVIHGGGHNHRVDLAGGVLIKENHIAAAGSVGKALSLCLKGAPPSLRVEVEVGNQDELKEALDAGAHSVLLDNMSLDEIERSVRTVKGRIIVEASGGINLDNVASIAATGVDVISVGALTHSARAADISFLLDGV